MNTITKTIISASISAERVHDWNVVRVTVQSIKRGDDIESVEMNFEADVRLSRDGFVVGAIEASGDAVLSYEDDADVYEKADGTAVRLSSDFGGELRGIIEDYVWRAQVEAETAYRDALRTYGF